MQGLSSPLSRKSSQYRFPTHGCLGIRHSSVRILLLFKGGFSVLSLSWDLASRNNRRQMDRSIHHHEEYLQMDASRTPFMLGKSLQTDTGAKEGSLWPLHLHFLWNFGVPSLNCHGPRLLPLMCKRPRTSGVTLSP